MVRQRRERVSFVILGAGTGGVTTAVRIGLNRVGAAIWSLSPAGGVQVSRSELLIWQTGVPGCTLGAIERLAACVAWIGFRSERELLARRFHLLLFEARRWLREMVSDLFETIGEFNI